MSIISWLLKPKKEMAKADTKHVKIGKYSVSAHAQNRTVQKDRSLKKTDMLDNLLRPPLYTTPTKSDKYGRKSYSRIGKKSVTWINPQSNVVTSTKKTNSRDIKGASKYDKR